MTAAARRDATPPAQSSRFSEACWHVVRCPSGAPLHLIAVPAEVDEARAIAKKHRGAVSLFWTARLPGAISRDLEF